MKQTLIFLPMAVLALWTLNVLTLVPLRRIQAGRKGLVTTEDFRLGESAAVPDDVRLPNRVFMNLLEVPVLFYFACVVSYLIQLVDPAMMWLAGAYVALRVLHTLIYFGYNHVGHRALVFGTSNVVVSVMWIRLLLALI